MTKIGNVVGNTSPQEYTFYLKSMAAKLGDLVCVEIEVPPDSSAIGKEKVLVWGRITELQRFNPFLPAEAGIELADEGLDLLDTVLSNSRDQIEATVLVLGATHLNDFKNLMPLSYPVQPGALVLLPSADAVKTILIGDDAETHRLRVGTLIGRKDIEVKLKTNILIARHMAILAMTGGGKTVVARRIIRELLHAKYPLVILDPHGDYLGFWEKRGLFKENSIKLFYPNLIVNEKNRDMISFLVGQMTQGFSDPQKDKFQEALDNIQLSSNREVRIRDFIDELMQELSGLSAQSRGTIPAVKRGLRFVKTQMATMEASNSLLRERLKAFPFEPMPDPITAPEKFVAPGQASIIYLGGYDHLTQSTIVALILKSLFEARSSMRNKIPPFLTVVEEAHNFIPSHGEGQTETPSVDIIRKVITEGRKFGVGLLLISQRPSRLDETTLSQCNSFIVLRLVNPRDQTFVEKVMENMTKSDSRLLPGFGPGQGIVSGQVIRFPLVVKFDFDSELASTGLGDEDFLAAIKTWEKSQEAAAQRRGEILEEELDKADK
jgi:hypothetical protein